MALTLNIDVVENQYADEAVFTETTGTYNVSTNTGGWGSPNATLGTVTSAILTIKDLDDNTLGTIDFSPFSSFPTNDETVEYTIVPADMGMTDKFTSGIYIFSYDVVATEGGLEQTFNKTCYVMFSQLLRCCVDKMYAAVDGFCTTCDKSKLHYAVEADFYLEAARDALGCGKVNMADAHLDKVEFMCNNAQCNCN
jgi:hypothetical protein